MRRGKEAANRSRGGVVRALDRRIRRHKGAFALYVALRLIVLACAAAALAFGNY